MWASTFLSPYLHPISSALSGKTPHQCGVRIGLYTLSSRCGLHMGCHIAKGVSERCVSRLLLTGWQCKIFSLSIILYYRPPGNNKEERDLVNKFSGLSIKSCNTKLSEDALDILTHDLNHNILSKGVKMKHLYKLPQSGKYYVMKVWNHINAPKGPMMSSHYKDWVVMEETEPKSFLCNCTEMASKMVNVFYALLQKMMTLCHQ